MNYKTVSVYTQAYTCQKNIWTIYSSYFYSGMQVYCCNTWPMRRFSLWNF